MRKSFITTVSAWRFERPLAIALAASATFMVMAVPPGRFPNVAGAQPLLALVVGLVLGALGYVAMTRPWPRVAAPSPVPEEEIVPEDEQSQFAAAEVSVRLRRADRHPDAPVRAPIFASRDLGSPFMEIGAFAAPPAEALAENAIPEADYAEVEADGEAAPAAAEPEPVIAAPDPEPWHAVVDHEPEPAAVAAPGWPIPDMPAPIAVFAPEGEPAPQPARTQRQSISALMDRLSAGLESRAAHGDPVAMPRDRRPALRDALEELNRLAARRG